jgi:hypothetical protein
VRHHEPPETSVAGWLVLDGACAEESTDDVDVDGDELVEPVAVEALVDGVSPAACAAVAVWAAAVTACSAGWLTAPAMPAVRAVDPTAVHTVMDLTRRRAICRRLIGMDGILRTASKPEGSST